MPTPHQDHRSASLTARLALAALAAASLAAPSLADGTETLGPTTVSLGQGTDLILAGVGLVADRAGFIDVSIPAGASVVQVIAYWEGLARTADEHGDTDRITIAGFPVTGARIGGVTHIINNNFSSTYRADITAFGLLTPGKNSLFIAGFDFGKLNDGFGLAVIVDDGSGDQTSLQLHDGNDYAYHAFAAPLDDTNLQTFSFDAFDEDRQAELGLMLGHVSSFRSSVIEVYVDGVLTEELLDVIGDLDGAEWDTYVHELTIPAGTTSVAIRPVSRDSVIGPKAGAGIASVTWVTASLALTTPAQASVGDEGCRPWFWALHPQRWDGLEDDATLDIRYWDSFNRIVGLTRRRTGLRDRASVMDALWSQRGWFWWQRILNRHTAAALANADSDMDYPFSVDEVVSMYRDAVGVDAGPETARSLIFKLATVNIRNTCTLFEK